MIASMVFLSNASAEGAGTGERDDAVEDSRRHAAVGAFDRRKAAGISAIAERGRGG